MWQTTQSQQDSSLGPLLKYLGFPGGSAVKNLPAVQETQETWVQSLGVGGEEDPLKEGMATHSSILAWRIPCMDRRAWWATVYRVAESDTTEATECACTC